MELHAQAPLHLIGGDSETVEAVVGTASKSLHHEVAVVIFSTRVAHGIDESLVVTILHGLLLRSWRSPVDRNLIGAREDQFLAVVTEIGGDGSPQSAQLAVVLLLFAVV